MSKQPNTLRRPITSTDLYRRKFNVLNFSGEWLAHIGRPEVLGSWLISGDSSQGKTRYTVKLAKYLGNFGKVYVDSLEEGESFSVKEAWEAEDINSARDNVYLLDGENIDTVEERLGMRNAPDFLIFDSVQFMRGFTQERYENLLDEWKKKGKLFIFTSHADGKKPKGALAEAINYRSFVKIRVEGYRAFAKSRYGGKQYFDIWPEESAKYFGDIL